MKTIHEVLQEAAMSETWCDKTPREDNQVDVEMTSLKKQLRSAHAAVTWTHLQMELQKKRTKQLIAAWKVRLEEGEEKTRQHQRILDNQMQKVASDLMYFECALKQEQRDIKISFANKDVIITAQKQTIDSLRRANVSLTKIVKKLRHKSKSTDSARNAHQVAAGVIQQEADKLVSQIFSQRKNSHIEDFSQQDMSSSSPLEYVEEVFTNSFPEQSFENGNNAPHTFYLTGGTKKNSLKLNASSIPCSSQSASGNKILKLQSRSSKVNISNVYSGYDYQLQRGGLEQERVMPLRNRAPGEMLSSKSCPNLGLAAIAEEISHLPDSVCTKTDSVKYSVDAVEYDIVSSNACSRPMSESNSNSWSAIKAHCASGISGRKDNACEDIHMQFSLQKQRAFGEESPCSEVHNDEAINEQDFVVIPCMSTMKQRQYPTSALNLLSKIRKPYSGQKSMVARANSEGDPLLS